MTARVPVKRPQEDRLRWVGPVSVRIFVLAIVALGAFAIVVPTMMQFLDQRAELRALEAERARVAAENDDLQTEIDRWSDSSYVSAQARERLSYGYDGERRYKVIDPQTVVDDTNPRTGQAIEPGAVSFPIGREGAWYGTLWESVEVAGGVSQTAADDGVGAGQGKGSDPAATDGEADDSGTSEPTDGEADDSGTSEPADDADTSGAAADSAQ